MSAYLKYELASSCLQPDIKSLLDVGCRDAVLKKFVRPEIKYAGLDLIPGPEVDYVANVERGLPFPDRSFDAVVALDLLEHTDNIWHTFNELMRIASKQVIVLMPNLYYWRKRILFAFGGEFDKYALPPSPIPDRHKWLPSYNSANLFFHAKAREFGCETIEYLVLRGPKSAVIDLPLSKISRNLAGWAVLHSMKKPASC